MDEARPVLRRPERIEGLSGAPPAEPMLAEPREPLPKRRPGCASPRSDEGAED
jgi:hypothetical protein